MPRALPALLALLLGGAALAQESASFKIKTPLLNSGGSPVAGSSPASAGFLLRPDALGEAAVGATAASGSFRLSGGFVQSFPPPGEVQDLVFSDSVTLGWDAEPFARHYHLYRTDPMGASTAVAPVGDCLLPEVAGLTATDPESPPVDRAFFYFVNAVNCTRIEGPAGTIGARCQ